MTTTATPRDAAQESEGFGTQIRYERINEPGAYVCNWSGHLLRMPDDSIKSGRSPRISISSTLPLFVTKISENPFIAVTKAPVLAADCDLSVRFWTPL